MVANSKAELKSILDVTVPPTHVKLNFADASFLYRSVIEPIDPNFTKISVTNWDVSNVTNMRYMFLDAYTFNQPIGDWDVSNVTNMDGMFVDASEFNQPIGDWDVSNVTDMSYMFLRAASFYKNLNSWDPVSLEDKNGVFHNSPMESNPPYWY